MEALVILVLALALVMDVFAVSLGIGAARQACALRPAFRLAFHSELFQAAMTLLGSAAGFEAAPLSAGIDRWVAAAPLAVVGAA